MDHSLLLEGLEDLTCPMETATHVQAYLTILASWSTALYLHPDLR